MLQNAFKRRRLSLCPSALELEPRSLLSGYSATSIEQLYLEELDDARFDPAAFGVSLGLDLSSVAPSQPLAMSPLLVESARLHSQDMIAQNYFSHTAPDGSGPEQRIQATGFPGTGWAESIEYNSEPVLTSQGFPANYAAANTEYSLGDLIVDQGNPTLGHRVMLLDIGGTFHAMRQVGIGLAFQDSPSGSYTYRQTDTTIDMSSTANSNPFLTGVVFNDTAANGEYEPGEGLSGVNISVAGVGSTTTSDAGGYSIQLAPGAYTVTASGGGLPAPITRTVVLGNDNARLNFDQNPNGATFSATTGKPASVTLGSFTAIEAGDTPSSYSARRLGQRHRFNRNAHANGQRRLHRHGPGTLWRRRRLRGACFDHPRKRWPLDRAQRHRKSHRNANVHRYPRRWRNRNWNRNRHWNGNRNWHRYRHGSWIDLRPGPEESIDGSAHLFRGPAQSTSQVKILRRDHIS